MLSIPNRGGKKVSNRLLQKGIGCWCPLQKVERQWSDRRKIIEDPVFKSYVFVQITEPEKLLVLQTDGVLRFVHFLGKPAIIKDWEIDNIKATSWKGRQDLGAGPPGFPGNDKVVIRHGIFSDNTRTCTARCQKKVLYQTGESWAGDGGRVPGCICGTSARGNRNVKREMGWSMVNG